MSESRILEEVSSFVDEQYVQFRIALWKQQSKRVKAGLDRARTRGSRLGRRPVINQASSDMELVRDLTVSGAAVARMLGVCKETVNRMRRDLRKQAVT